MNMMNPLICSKKMLTGHGRAIGQHCSIKLWYSKQQANGCLALMHMNIRNNRNYRSSIQVDISQNLLLNKPYLHVRTFYSSPTWRSQESSSKVEETVKRIKEQTEDKQKAVEASKSELTHAPPKAVVEQKSLWTKIKGEILHYYHGFRLLGLDMKVSAKLIWRICRGYELTRREHRLLVKTTGDVFRLIPFSVFIIVPFMEFLLPFAIKFFPGLLPSTFQTATEKEDKLKQALKVKLEVAKFLQKTLDDMAVQSSGDKSVQAKEFAEFFYKIRTSGAVATTEEIMQFSKLFEDEITLDSLSRPQLVALCRVLDVQTLGTTNFLRFLLRMRLRSLVADDKLIQKEGVDSLTRSELQQACKARGMRAYGMPESRLKQQITQWLDLSLNKKVPPSLLLLSRALMVPETIPMPDKLKATISALPDTIVTRTQGAIGEKEGKLDHKTSIEIIKMEERKIEEERKEQQDSEPVSATEPSKKYEITAKDMKVLEQALDEVGKGKKLAVEKEEIKELKEEMADYQEDIKELSELKASSKGQAEIEAIKESKGAKRLYNRVNKMIQKMDVLLTQLEETEKRVNMKINDTDSETGIKDAHDEKIRIDELITAIKSIQNVPDENRVKRIQEILGKIDDDRDGALEIEDVLKVLELIGKEDVKLNKRQLTELLELLEKEETVETNLAQKIEKDRQDLCNEREAARKNECPPKPTDSCNPCSDDAKNVEDEKKCSSSTDSDKSGSVFEDSPPKSITETPITPPVPPSSKKAEGSKQL